MRSIYPPYPYIQLNLKSKLVSDILEMSAKLNRTLSLMLNKKISNDLNG